MSSLTEKLANACGKSKNHDRAAEDRLHAIESEKLKLEQTLSKLTDACEKLKGQLEGANSKSIELEQQVAKLDAQNSLLHHKVAQAKASIVQGDADSTPDLVSRQESSKLRCRLDDSSQISKDKRHHMSSVLSDENPRRNRGFSPERFEPATTPELDFEDVSMNENIPRAIVSELERLRDENIRLKT